jgi:uncharacterized membrane protein
MHVLVAGESWITQATHIKGVDHFTVSSYVEGIAPLRDALEAAGHTVEHLPAHLVPDHFPFDADALASYDVVVLSDIGANSLALPRAVMERSETRPNRLQLLADWVRAGGGLVMVGGYLSFSGFEAKAAFRSTPVEEVLPVDCVVGDDRVEAPQGLVAELLEADHPALGGVAAPWPALLGYNRTTPVDGARVLATLGGEPLIAVREIGRGRTAVFTSDCAPHWAPPAFCEQWDGYAPLWQSLLRWTAGGGAS